MTDSQYLASIEISEDQNTITGVTLVAVECSDPYSECRKCALVGSGSHICRDTLCMPNHRADGRSVIFVVKVDD